MHELGSTDIVKVKEVQGFNVVEKEGIVLLFLCREDGAVHGMKDGMDGCSSSVVGYFLCKVSWWATHWPFVQQSLLFFPKQPKMIFDELLGYIEVFICTSLQSIINGLLTNHLWLGIFTSST